MADKGFELRVGDHVLKTDTEKDQVLKLSIRTAQGETAAIGVQNLDWAEIVIETEGRLVPNLLQVERDQHRRMREFGEEHAKNGAHRLESFSVEQRSQEDAQDDPERPVDETDTDPENSGENSQGSNPSTDLGLPTS